jgi:hypothetical protein
MVIMSAKTEYQDITEEVGSYEGYPIERTCTAEEQEEAVKDGIPLQDFLDWYFQPHESWLRDC